MKRILLVVIVLMMFVAEHEASAETGYKISLTPRQDYAILYGSGPEETLYVTVGLVGGNADGKTVKSYGKRILYYLPLTKGNGRYIISVFNAKDMTKYKYAIFDITSQEGYVDASNPIVVELAKKLRSYTSVDTARNINNWIIDNMAYDSASIKSNSHKIMYASESIKSKKGICIDFAIVYSALCRANGIKCNVVIGDTTKDKAGENHAWNEVLIGDIWYSVDSTWADEKNDYFMLPNSEFNKEHMKSYVASY